MFPASRLVFVLLALAACSSSDSSSSGNHDAASTNVVGIELMSKMAGLWSGPASDTQLGDFPLKNMDFRAAGDSVLFARVDLDAANSLRFGFAVEVVDNASSLVFRNGGLFSGLPRDTRTKLFETDGTYYRFCELSSGCDFVDVEFRFDSATKMTMKVFVNRMLHETWSPTRVETRALPDGFPAKINLSSTADFPAMPSAKTHVTWNGALTEPALVWVILSQTNCVPNGDCHFSRWISAQAPAGATSVDITQEQLHPGDYALLAVVDANQNLATALFPDTGDKISVPSPTVSVAANGESSLSVNAAVVVVP